MKAIGKNIIIKAIKKEKKKEVIINPLASNKPELWEVISIGSEVKDVIPGDIICINQYGAAKLIQDNDDLYIVNVDQVLAKQ